MAARHEASTAYRPPSSFRRIAAIWVRVDFAVRSIASSETRRTPGSPDKAERIDHHEQQEHEQHPPEHTTDHGSELVDDPFEKGT